MSEEAYYAKIRFNSHEEAEAALKPIQEFLKEGALAKEFWQANRPIFQKEQPLSPDQFWMDFRTKFPMVMEYLNHMEFKGDCDNGLSGLLDFGNIYDIEDAYVYRGVIKHCALVWGMADWDPMLNFIGHKWHAIAWNYVSDVNAGVNYFDYVHV